MPVIVRAQTEAPAYEDVTAIAGVQRERMGLDEKITGQAWGDYDGDGWLDLYITDTEGPNTLYHNQQDGTFVVSALSDSVALADAVSGGATFVDYDNDGWSDLFVVNWGENALFRNEAGDRFVDVTAVAGVGDNSNGKTASWGDYNQDGWLDLYVANWACYPQCGRPSEGDRDRLYRNNGDGTFADVTNVLGGKTRGAGFVASFVDYDNDQDLDIYLINDEFINPIGNVLWRNDGPGCDEWCFTNVSVAAQADTQVMGMGLATADYDADGDLDFYFSNAGPMTLLQNQGDGTFADMAPMAGVDLPATIGWGAVFLDYDNDGWSDLYVAIMEAMGEDAIGSNALFRNNGDGSFTDLAAASGAANVGRTIGVAYADYDRDGWLDLIIGNYDEGYVLYRNRMGEQSDYNWLQLQLQGRAPINRDGVGTRVYVTDSNGRVQMQEVKNGSSLGAGNSLALHFGLGQATVQDVRVIWPDGSEEVIGALTPNRQHRLVYGEATRKRQLAAREVVSVAEQVILPISSDEGNLVNLSLLIAVILVVGLFVLLAMTWQRRRR